MLLPIRCDSLRHRLGHFKLGAHLLDLRRLLFELSREGFNLFFLLGDRCLQLLNFAIESRVGLRGFGSGWALASFWIESTRVGSGSQRHRSQPSIRIDEHETRDAGLVVNWRTIDVVNKTPVTYLAKTTVNTR